MSMVQIFGNKHWLDIALAASATDWDEQQLLAHLQRGGVPAECHADFCQSVRTLAALRVQAHCEGCRGPGAHLDENTLAEFVDGVLSAAEAEEVERQFAVCGSCLKKAVELAQLTEELVAKPALPQVVLGLARRGLRMLVQPLGAIAEQPLEAVAVLSSGTDALVARRWNATSGFLEATFTALLEDDGAVSLSVLPTRKGQPLQHGRLALRLEDSLMESVPLRGDEVHFHRLDPGAYTVEVDSGTDLGLFGVVLSPEE